MAEREASEKPLTCKTKLSQLLEEIEENDNKIKDIEHDQDLLRIDAAKIEARLKELKGEKG